jgi:hypothetical protein
MLTALFVTLALQSVLSSPAIPQSTPCSDNRDESCQWAGEWWHSETEAPFRDGDTVEIAGLTHVRRSGGWFREAAAIPLEDLTHRAGPGRHELVARVVGSIYRRVYATSRQCHRARSVIVASTRQAEGEAPARSINPEDSSAAVCIPID